MTQLFLLQPGVEFFQSMDKIFASGVGACGSVTVTVPEGSGQKSMKFMILRETDNCIYAKCGSEAGFNVSKTKNCKKSLQFYYYLDNTF